MDNVLLNIISCAGVREVLLHSLVHPHLFTKQTWKLLCKKILSASWSDYKHISTNPRRRFVEIAYRKGLQPSGLSLYSNEYLILFTLFSRDLVKLREMAKRYPQAASALHKELVAKKKKYFFQREVLVLAEELGISPNWCSGVVAEAEEGSHFLTADWDVATRLLINGDEQSLTILEILFFPKRSLGGMRPDSCSQSLRELVLQDSDRVFDWLCAYSFSRDEHMIRELLKKTQLNFTLETVLCNLYTVNNLSLAREIEKERNHTLSFDEKLECLANYYLFSGDDKGLYTSLLEVMKEKQPLQKFNIIFHNELYEVRELLKGDLLWP